MAFYADEEDVWKCTKHPAGKRRRCNGVCPACLRERLGSLCPLCANVRPCACCTTTTTTTTTSALSSSSSSSSASHHVSEPAFRRSRSVGVQFLRSRFSAGEKAKLSNDHQKNIPAADKQKTASFWSIFKSKRCRKSEDVDHNNNNNNNNNKVVGNEVKEKEESNDVVSEDYLYRVKIEDFERMLMRSRSVSVSSARRGGDVTSSPSMKVKGWHFTSPMKVFRQKSSSKVVHNRSPLL